jgi:nitrate reductase NapD
MNLSSVVLRAVPERLPELRAALAARPGHEVHGEHAAGRLAITIESESAGAAADAYVALHDLPGVLAVSLIYQYGDDGPASGRDALPVGLAASPAQASTESPSRAPG